MPQEKQQAKPKGSHPGDAGAYQAFTKARGRYKKRKKQVEKEARGLTTYKQGGRVKGKADPRFNPDRKKSEAVKTAVEMDKDSRRFVKGIGAINRKAPTQSDHRFRPGRGEETKERKEKGWRPAPSTQLRRKRFKMKRGKANEKPVMKR